MPTFANRMTFVGCKKNHDCMEIFMARHAEVYSYQLLNVKSGIKVEKS